MRGKQDTFNLDLATSWKFSDSLSFTLEAINLTDQFDERYISSVRQNSESFEHTGRQTFVGFRFRPLSACRVRAARAGGQRAC